MASSKKVGSKGKGKGKDMPPSKSAGGPLRRNGVGDMKSRKEVKAASGPAAARKAVKVREVALTHGRQVTDLSDRLSVTPVAVRTFLKEYAVYAKVSDDGRSRKGPEVDVASIHTKLGLVKHLSEAMGVRESLAKEFLESLEGLVSTVMKKSKRFVLPGIGTLTAVDVPKRAHHNPMTREKVWVKAHRKVKFAVCGRLKKEVWGMK